MVDDDDLTQERDDFLVSTFVSVAMHYRSAYHEWIQEELNHWIPKAEAIEETLSGELRTKLQAQIQRMKDMNRYELPEAVNNLKDKCSDINAGAWQSVMDALPFLEEGIFRFTGLVRELLDIRRLLDDLWE